MLKMKRMFNYLTGWLEEEGATATEYAIMVATIAIVIVATVTIIGLKLFAIFGALIGKF